MMSEIFNRLTQYLSECGAAHQIVEHEPTRTSEESAQVRGTPLASGAKALVLKLTGPAGAEFATFVLPADRRLDPGRLRACLNITKCRFVTGEELKSLTGLVPGSVPPFGPPVMPLKVYVDSSLRQSEPIAFNAGSPSVSIVMPREAYFDAVRATEFTFSEEVIQSKN